MPFKKTTVAANALLFVLLFAALAPAQTSSLLGRARDAFNSAQQLEAALSSKAPADRTRAEYIKVINTYQRVYLITPHTGYADNALIAMARLYEDIKDTRAALRTWHFLLSEYPQTSFAGDAQKAIERLDGLTEVQAIPVSKEAQAPKKEIAVVENIRYWEAPNSVRVVVDVDAGVSFEQGEAKSPERVFIDISPARLNSELLGKQWPVQSGLLEQIRVGQYDNATVRVVLDVGNIGNITSFKLRDPDRIVIDVLGQQTAEVQPARPETPARQPIAAPVAAAGPPPTAQPVIPAAAVEPAPEVKIATAAKPTNDGARSLIRSLGLKLSRVVIDAGHGGQDTGTIGPTGYTEKELVLDVASRLKELISANLGAEVVMTRTKDVFVPLETRTAIANQHEADLFISIHANSSKVKSVRGVETFVLNITTSREVLDTAARENATSGGLIHELDDIVKKIMMRDKVDESRDLAQHIQKSLAALKGSGPDRGVKEAPFVVLIGANMPSVLAEIGFISNPSDERMIKTAVYRQQIAESLFEGVRSYSDTLSGLKTARIQE